jgi:hypothetical protein
VQYNKRVFFKKLTCPTCGDGWKRVISDQFIRLGRPVIECRACWSPIPTGQQEWADMNGRSRAGYILQNAILLLPPLGLFLVALGLMYFVIGLEDDDAITSVEVALAIAAGLFILSVLHSVVLILFSLRRTAKRRRLGSAKK